VNLFVTAAKGTEKALRDELREIGLKGPKADRGGVRLRGDLEAVARICLGSRIAVRVLVEVGHFECPDEDALYAGVEAIEWERWLSPERTLAVSAVSRRSALTHTNYIAQRTKDAVVDRQRRRRGRRSSVDRRDPDLAIFVHLRNDRAGVFLDASGQSLHRRGWRTRGGAAPLKETLAAAIVRMSGWDRASPLVDPMCGSGTLPIEADLWAREVPPQPRARRFGFERWADHDATAARRMTELRAALEARARASGPEILGADADAAAVKRARANARRAGAKARFSVAPLATLRRDGPGHLLSNPPYGRRLGADRGFWEELRQAIRRLPEHRVTLLLPEKGAPRDLGRGRRARAVALYNGRVRCTLVTFEPQTRGR
jgi:putative N6-adenine-specific DNA methylase